ncbi:hypothetical protein [Cesiribacter sp. SM1]|uniref:hypothetical protein n=1 Tax=Cesiribacter sp. SM1 TaxID=2861196 RepID=UPI001CD653A7|nr:hypothetical protein [Cesiribacter sp. SM1]
MIILADSSNGTHSLDPTVPSLVYTIKGAMTVSETKEQMYLYYELFAKYIKEYPNLKWVVDGTKHVGNDPELDAWIAGEGLGDKLVALGVRNFAMIFPEDVFGQISLHTTEGIFAQTGKITQRAFPSLEKAHEFMKTVEH